MYEECFPAVNFNSIVEVFNNVMVWSAFPYSCVLFNVCKAYVEIGLLVLM